MSSLPLRKFAQVRWLLGAVILLLVLGSLLSLVSLGLLLRAPKDELDPLLATAASVASALRQEGGGLAQPAARPMVLFAGERPVFFVGSVPLRPYWPFASRAQWEAAGRPVKAFGTWNGQELQVVLWPLPDQKLLEVFAPAGEGRASPWLYLAMGLSLLLSCLGGSLAWFLVGRLLAPYGELLEEARSFAGKSGAGPEDRFLVSTFRQAVERVEQQERELKGRAQELSELAAGLAHELRNNLSVMDGYLRLAKANPQDVPRYLAILAQEVLRLRDFLERFLTFVHPRKLQGSWVNVAALAEEVAQRLQSQFANVDFQHQGQGQAWADATAVSVVLENLLRNAFEAASQKPGGRVWVHLQELARWVEVEVGDTGPGIEESLREQVFEPFVSHKAGGGIGLALARRLARACGGEVELVSPAQPTRFLLRLPREVKG